MRPREGEAMTMEAWEPSGRGTKSVLKKLLRLWRKPLKVIVNLGPSKVLFGEEAFEARSTMQGEP
jgi:hypothetical protein